MGNALSEKVKTVLSVSAFFLMALFMIPRNDPSESVRRSLAFCASSLVPSLFVSTVFGKILASNIRIKRKNINIKLVLYGLICGFPFGAISGAELYKNGSITKKQSEIIVATSNSASASFIVSYVGGVSLGSLKAGVFLFAGNAVITVLWYLIVRSTDGKEEKPHIYNHIYNNVKTKNPVAAIAESAQTLISVCGCVVFFSVISDFVCRNIQNDVIKAVISGFFEMSGGIKSSASLKPGEAYTLSGIIVGWSGLSVLSQVVLASEGIRTRRFVIGRIFQASAMGIFAVITKKYII